MQYIDFCNASPSEKKMQLNKILTQIALHQKWCTKKFSIKWACRYALKGEYEQCYLNLSRIYRCLENLAA
jgi:hypothetical protein